MKSRLSIMMFLQYTAPGLVLPILSHYLKNYLHFAPIQIGIIMATTAAAAIVAPFLVVQFADRFISAARLLGLCHFLAGFVMLILARQTTFWPFLLLYFAHGMLFMPTFALTNAVAFHHLRDARREFGAVRMWGPVSWVAAAFLFSFLWLSGGPGESNSSRLGHALVFSGLSSCLLGVFSFWLPARPAASEAPNPAPPAKSPWASLRLFTRPALLILCVTTLLNAMVHQFYYFGMGPFLSQIGYADKYIMPAMSMGQLGEAFTLALLGLCLTRLTMKQALIIGVLAQTVRSLAFATGHPLLTLLLIPSHGICYAFFFAVAYIYVDNHCRPADRAGAQLLFNILIAGFGNLIGNLLAGQVGQWLTDPATQDIAFGYFWSLCAAMATAIAVMLALWFREESREPSG